MAITLLQWEPVQAQLPSTLACEVTSIAEASSGAGSAPNNPDSVIAALGFPVGDPTNSYCEFTGIMPVGYVVTVTINVILTWRSYNDSSTNVRFGAQLKAMSDADAYSRAWATTVEGNFAAASTAGRAEYSTLALTSAGGSLDGVVAGELVRLRIYRESTDSGDTHPATAYITNVRMET